MFVIIHFVVFFLFFIKFSFVLLGFRFVFSRHRSQCTSVTFSILQQQRKAGSVHHLSFNFFFLFEFFRMKGRTYFFRVRFFFDKLNITTHFSSMFSWSFIRKIYYFYIYINIYIKNSFDFATNGRRKGWWDDPTHRSESASSILFPSSACNINIIYKYIYLYKLYYILFLVVWRKKECPALTPLGHVTWVGVRAVTLSE